MWRNSLWFIVFAGISFEGFGKSPASVIHDSTDHIIVTLEAPDPTLTIKQMNDTKYASLAITGFTNLGEVGGPSLPTFSRLIAIPYGKKAVVAAVKQETGTFNVEHPLAPFTGIPRHCSDKRESIGPDQGKYAAFRSEPVIEIGESSFLGPIKVAALRFNPIRVSHSSNKLKIVRKAIVRINFVKDRSRPLRPPLNPSDLSQQHYQFFRTMVLNDGAFPRFARTNRVPTDLIIVHHAYTEEVQRLVQFKEANGRSVIVKPFTNPTRMEVMQYVKEKYRSSNPPDHTLIIGNIDQIPSYRRGSFWTDYNYSLLDSGPYPDISLGRLAANDSGELRSQIAKIIGRETSERTNGRFLITSGFETSWCQENLNYIMQNILAHSQQEITIDKRYASEGHRTASILEGYNAEPNIIIYDGHGNQDGMTELPLYRQHLNRLSNSTFPIVLDIACLNSQWPTDGASQTNFADRISSQASHGVAGILASSYYSGGHDLFRHILRAAVFDEHNPSEPYHMINEIGRMIHYGKVKYLEQYGSSTGALDDNHMFYYHGDPASTFFSESK